MAFVFTLAVIAALVATAAWIGYELVMFLAALFGYFPEK
jgi:hypothetical protein